MDWTVLHPLLSVAASLVLLSPLLLLCGKKNIITSTAHKLHKSTKEKLVDALPAPADQDTAKADDDAPDISVDEEGGDDPAVSMGRSVRKVVHGKPPLDLYLKEDDYAYYLKLREQFGSVVALQIMTNYMSGPLPTGNPEVDKQARMVYLVKQAQEEHERLKRAQEQLLRVLDEAENKLIASGALFKPYKKLNVERNNKIEERRFDKWVRQNVKRAEYAPDCRVLEYEEKTKEHILGQTGYYGPYKFACSFEEYQAYLAANPKLKDVDFYTAKACKFETRREIEIRLRRLEQRDRQRKKEDAEMRRANGIKCVCESESSTTHTSLVRTPDPKAMGTPRKVSRRTAGPVQPDKAKEVTAGGI